MDNNEPLVSIVVPCRNERDHIETALKSILAQERSAGNFEVVVADGMSDDGTREILLRLALADSRIRIIDNQSRIVSTGLNAAIREARGSIIMRMDAHTEYAPDYVRQCVEVLQETAADNVGGPWIACGKGNIGKAIAAAFQSPFSCGGARGHDANYSGPLDTVYLGCWHREIFDRIGFFDEELVRNQDDEFNLRIVRSGGKIWQSVRIKSCYYPRESLPHLFAQYLQYGYWKARILQKHRLPASLRHLIPAGSVLMLALLPILSVVWRPAFWIWIILLGLYSGANFALSLATGLLKGWKLVPLLPCIFAIFHFAYGWGFLRGITDFIILRRNSGQFYDVLTRQSKQEVVRGP
jgi:glycosyltransferase involved in cell wall biosynthesis